MQLLPLTASGLVRRYGDLVVLDGLDLVAAPGRRIGLIGENGVGKSTLLRLLAGVERPDSGSVSRPADVAYLQQEPTYAADATVGSVLDSVLAPLHRAVLLVEELGARLADGLDPGGAAEAYADALADAELHDAWDADRRAGTAAQRLGLAGFDRDRPVDTLSGGQRTRLTLAATVVRRPACVLLDEPTNHLDDEATELVEAFLAGLPGVVVVASHDRVLLDRVCTDLVDLDPRPHAGRRHHGGFTDYLAHKRDARRQWEQTYATQQAQLAHLRRQATTTARQVTHDRPPRDGDRFIYAFKGGNVQRTIARRVRDVERRITLAEREQVRRPPEPLRLDPGPLMAGRGPGDRLAVSVRRLRITGRVALDHLDLATGEHLLATGVNGSGKSSLLLALAGRLRPTSGTVAVRAGRVGLLDQDDSFADEALTAERTYATLVGREQAESRPLVGLGLVHPRDLTRPVGALSTGQRRRLALAAVIASSPDLLLLDEPTNHLSLRLVAELEDAVGAAAGTVVLASHDRWVRRRWKGSAVQLEPR